MKIKHSLSKLTSLAALTLSCSFIFSFAIQAQEIPSTSPEPSSDLPAPVAHTESSGDLMQDSYKAFAEKNYDLAVEKASQAIALEPQNKQAYIMRGSVYAEEKEWDKANADYQQAIAIDPKYSAAKFDLAELSFMQKKYDDARTGFDALKSDPEIGDFAIYKSFLCDLLGGHEDAATKDLDALNQVGGNPSYYFGNAAWDLVHNKPADAAGWLKSAAHIYARSPQKFATYTHSLMDLGYLPIHLSSTP